METATVLHLSDLHFGADEDETVWNAFIDHVRTMQPRPTAALITGDVVDSPHDRFFRRANKNLMALSQVLGGTAENYAENVFVCPGNHDRYWMGNRLLPSLLPKFGNYDKFLNKREVNQPFITYVGSATNRWKLWISQVDTSQHAGIFAQGFVNQRELKLIRGLKKEGYDPETPFSLVILMMHHHALPIASLEPEDPKKHFFAFTNPTNPGRILEGLIDGHVDLVLHGHEHRSHAARYALYNSDKGELAVVGAGSATGMYTDEFRCVVSKSSFNLIEFRSDRSVWLRVMNGAGSYEAPSWAEARDLSVQLLGGTAIRRNRFLRIRTQETATAQTQPADHPKQYGEWQRHITLTPYRDALVWDKRSHWPLKGGKLGFQLINETGLPVLPKASIYLKNRPGRAEKVKDVQIGRIEGETRIFGFVACVSPKLAEDVESIETSFKWDDAIMLTQSDMALLDRNNVSGLRSRGLEFVAATVPKDIPLATLTLTVTFPVGYRPKRPRVSVQVLNTNKADDGFIEDKALGARLQMAGQTLVLAIPYPLTGYRYAIAWPPVAEPTQKAEGKKRLIDRLVANEKFGADLAAIAADTFVREGWSSGNSRCVRARSNSSEWQDHPEADWRYRGTWTE